MLKRIFFSTDVHGSTRVWKKWLSAKEMYNANALMLCGDLSGKGMVPFIEDNNGTYHCNFQGRKWILDSSNAFGELQDKLASLGLYWLKCNREEVVELQNDPGKVEKAMEKAIVQRIREWLDLLMERIDVKENLVVVMPGNDDVVAMDEVIRSYMKEGIHSQLDEVIDIEGFQSVGLAHVNPTPWDTPREADEKQLARMIKDTVAKVADPTRTIFNFHCPPYGTNLDVAPELDKHMKPVRLPGGEVSMVHVGSKSVRAAIEEYRPTIGLHGHVHESSAADTVMEIPVINPGSEYAQGLLRGFIIELTEKGVQKFWRIEG